MAAKDYESVIEMMRVFYSSSAVATNGSEEIFRNDIDNCIGDCPYLEGYVFLYDNSVAGYAMLAKSFSTEYGKPCIWIEDIYIKPEFRGMGIGTEFFADIERKYPNCLLRLEVEKYNQSAIKFYKKSGYEFLPYSEMKKDLKP
ncbi:MAG: GNAT family N-acetyltransferase [Clostridiales bacterium]|nr:GNAT family N-acetyltransferase [Clostridiales bacterium]